MISWHSTVLATRQYVDIAISRAVVPGALRFFARSTAPEGYLICDGQALSRHTYAALFEAIGITSSTVQKLEKYYKEALTPKKRQKRKSSTTA